MNRKTKTPMFPSGLRNPLQPSPNDGHGDDALVAFLAPRCDDGQAVRSATQTQLNRMGRSSRYPPAAPHTPVWCMLLTSSWKCKGLTQTTSHWMSAPRRCHNHCRIHTMPV
ncbi:MAG: hypothetical protein UW71_C0005G0012 [Parcubacteria group bacterium GW2011_GWB1_44_7]|nr:MAG: hypothetical protein UW71_C0005G0012 [Parcubacteria group bacterium GW2011_GWB1_44_7]